MDNFVAKALIYLWAVARLHLNSTGGKVNDSVDHRKRGLEVVKSFDGDVLPNFSFNVVYFNCLWYDFARGNLNGKTSVSRRWLLGHCALGAFC